MKHEGIIILAVLIFAFSSCATSNTSPNITAETVSAKPTVFCTVLNEPNPLLIGGWQCRTFDFGSILNDPLEYWLVKNDNQYALFFYYKSRDGLYIGWRQYIIDGNEIRFSSDGKTTVPGYMKFLTENGKVYFVTPKGQKNEMTRIP